MAEDPNCKSAKIHIRVSEREKQGILELARRKGLVVSQIFRNYIDSLLEKELPELPNPDKLHDETSLSRSFTFQCSKELRQYFQDACAKKGLRVSGHIRAFMQDFADLLNNHYPKVPYSTESRLMYLEMFLKNEMQKQGLQHEKTWSEPIHFPADVELPIIDMVTPFHYIVYDAEVDVAWHITFTQAQAQ